MMQWLMQNMMLEYDNRQMQERYVHYDAMKRCLCDAWYECIYGHESPKNYLFLLAHLGAQCPTCTVKKVIWTFQLPVTKDETNIQCMLEIKCGSNLIRINLLKWNKIWCESKTSTSIMGGMDECMKRCIWYRCDLWTREPRKLPPS